MKRNLIVKQVDECDCGACCLLSIIRYYKGNVPLEIIKIDTNTTSNGVNALDLINAAQKYGLEGKGIKLNDLTQLKYPLIAHVFTEEIFHFIVIYKIKDNILTIMDPAKGKIKLSKDEFIKIWTGNILEFKKTTEIVCLKSNPTLLKLIKLFLMSNKKSVINLYIIEITLILLMIINSFNIKLINSHLFLFALIFFLCLVLESIIKRKKDKMLITLKNNFNLELTKNFFSHVLTLPLKIIQLKSTGEILTRFKELNVLSEFIINILFKNIIEIIISLSIFIIIFLINPKISLLTFFFFIIIIITSYCFKRIIKNIINKEINNESIYNEKLNEYINNIETIKALDSYKYFFKKFNLNLKDKTIHSIKFENLILNEVLIKDFVISFAYLLFIIYSIYLKIDIINLVTLLNLENIFFETIKNLFNDVPYYSYVKSIFIKLNEFLDIKEEKKQLAPPKFSGNISFKNVKYKYNNIKTLMYNFIIPKNKFIMIKGKNGSGKSTLCKLITKTITNYTGEILIGNKNIKDYQDEEIRNIINYSNQSAKLFKGTIKENIILDNKYDEEQFSLIKKICDLESVVKDKINRYESIIYENSTNFSGGEVQKIILARTLLANKDIIILDETLSALNINSEIKIIKNMKKHLKNKTIIYITHKNLEKYFDDCIELERND